MVDSQMSTTQLFSFEIVILKTFCRMHNFWSEHLHFDFWYYFVKAVSFPLVQQVNWKWLSNLFFTLSKSDYLLFVNYIIYKAVLIWTDTFMLFVGVSVMLFRFFGVVLTRAGRVFCCRNGLFHVIIPSSIWICVWHCQMKWMVVLLGWQHAIQPA